jgi:hypothetical protein
MLLTPFHKILYGPQRPWIEKELNNVIAGNTTVPAGIAVKRYSAVHTLPPLDKASLIYIHLIDQYENEALKHITEAVKQKDNEVDKTYVIGRASREIEELIKETAAMPVEDVSASGSVTAFVFNHLQLTLVNLFINLRLLYDDQHSAATDLVKTRHDVPLHNYPTTAEAIYLTLLDRQPPDPSPFYRTLTWYEDELKHVLLKAAEDQSEKEAQTHVASFITDLIHKAEEKPPVYPVSSIYPLIHHAENALFLIKLPAAFIANRPQNIQEAALCNEWVEGHKKDVMDSENNENSAADIMRAHNICAEIENELRPVSNRMGKMKLSAMRTWRREFMLLQQSAGEGWMMEGEKQTEDDTPIDFITYIKRHYVSREELADTLGISKKTLRKHLKGAKIGKMTLGKKNVLYNCKDVERFLKEDE